MTALIASIEGYASVFNAPDLNGDIVAPGAFAASLKKKKPAMLYSHAAEAPIGRWISLREDAHGLFVTGELILSSPRAREVHALLEGGALDGLSIGYQTARSVRTKSGRRILEADLWEVSIVTFPMAAGARVTRVGPARPEFDPEEAAKIFTRSARARRCANEESARRRAEQEAARRRADHELTAAIAVKRAPARPSPTPASPGRRAGARLFAEAMSAAAKKLSV